MRYHFIENHREAFAVRRMCKLMAVSPSGYYAWRERPASRLKMANDRLIEKIKDIHAEFEGKYGSPRIYQELQEKNISCSENRVARLMRKNGIQAKHKRCFRVTTKANPTHPVAPNLLDRTFTAAKPNQKWTSDITYIFTKEGWLYLAVVLDLFSRRIVGWAMSMRITSNLVINALEMAVEQRKPNAGLLHHSDRGSQYTGKPYRKLLAANKMLVSMSGKGDCWDNAPTESFFSTLKREQVHHKYYETRDSARTDIFFYIEAFYNRKRRHSTLNYLNPAAFEEIYFKNQSVSSLCL
jgi:putative transposase